MSWPGNDFYGGRRATDDGVKAAATNVMEVMTGISGTYNRRHFKYNPPTAYKNWEAVIAQNDLRLTVENRLLIY